MSISLFNQNLKEARRDALVSHYLATHDFSSLPEGSSVTTADDLYEYLLLDTKISNAVTTSRLAEAISSLQLFIHRSLEGYDGELADGATQYLAQGAFLNNWDQYNKRYSTWAGKEKLRFYAGNYVEPSLRLGKTNLFKTFEQQLNQGKLTTELVYSAVRFYLDGYDKYAHLKYLSASYYDNEIYIVACNGDEYFWRKLSLASPGINTEWHPLPPTQPHENNIYIIKEDGSLYLLYASKGRRQINNESFYIFKTYKYLLSQESWRRVEVSEDIGIAVKSLAPGFIVQQDTLISGVIKHKVNEEEKAVINYCIVKDDTKPNTYDLRITPTVLNNNEGYKLFVDGIRVALTEGVMTSEGFFMDDYPKSFEIKTPSDDSLVMNIYYPQTFLGNLLDDGKIFIVVTTDEEGTVREWDLSAPKISGHLDMAAFYDAGSDDFFGYGYQSEINSAGAWDILNHSGEAFDGPFNIYLWEIFFHIPYLVAARFAAEHRFEEAERWYKYIFNSAGYRDEDGKVLTDDNGQPRYWNCYPLQQDVAWDSFAAMPASTDPDVIATADPMHYKLAIFEHTLDLLIARGDAAYRLLERDTLTEAKMYYVQALQLLGPRPDIRVTNTWLNPTLAGEAGAIQEPVTRSSERASLTFVQWLRAGDTNEMGDGDFLPPYNDVLLAYWDKLDIRLYNLRHNLSLDGQPLSLPLFATPVDPAELHRQQSGGDGVQGDVSPADGKNTGWRYPLLAIKAQESVNRLKEFGSGLLSALEKQDSEKVTMLLQSQQSNVLDLQQEIAQKNLDGLNAELAALNSSREGLVLNQQYYTSLINGDLSAAEAAGLELRGGSMLSNTAAGIALLPAGALRAIPNIFGLADGGSDFGAPVEAAAQNMQIAAQVLDQSAAVSEITASYQRRAADWRQQSELAAKSIEETDNRIDSLKAQIAMQQKQIAMAEMEYANQQAYLDLYNSCFTGLTLYSWMVSRLSSLYYQLYDATIPVCIQAREALKRELGNNRADGIFSTPVWNNLYQGLLAGEGLTTGLQKLENVWIQNSANGLEATRTVSLAALRGEESGSLNAVITGMFNNSPDTAEVGKLNLDAETGIFSAVLDMSALKLADDYGSTSSNKNLFIKSIAVTLPTLLGPYQDIAATLSDSNGTVATLSHGMQDTGRFIVNFDDSRFLPFEGSDPTTLVLTLSIFNVKEAGDAAPNQRSIVENLSDVIFHIRYIIRDRQS
ncbi:neuraminidase-like domain-containing protein [Enterobacter cancerogenus]